MKRLCWMGLARGTGKEFKAGNFEGRILGDDRFAEQALRQTEEKYARQTTVQEIVATVCKVYG